MSKLHLVFGGRVKDPRGLDFVDSFAGAAAGSGNALARSVIGVGCPAADVAAAAVLRIVAGVGHSIVSVFICLL